MLVPVSLCIRLTTKKLIIKVIIIIIIIISRDVAEIREAGAEMGLVLNPVKCELISHRDDAVSDQFLAKWILATPPYWGHPYSQVQYLTRPGRTVVTTLRRQWTD